MHLDVTLPKVKFSEILSKKSKRAINHTLTKGLKKIAKLQENYQSAK